MWIFEVWMKNMNIVSGEWAEPHSILRPRLDLINFCLWQWHHEVVSNTSAHVHEEVYLPSKNNVIKIRLSISTTFSGLKLP